MAQNIGNRPSEIFGYPTTFCPIDTEPTIVYHS